MRSRRLRGPILAVLAFAAAAAVAAPPPPGRYGGELCVTVGAGRQSCGPAELRLDGDGTASARVDDVVYRLQLRRDEVAVLLTQGAGELDQFVADYRWEGHTLRFADVERAARYELRFGRRR